MLPPGGAFTLNGSDQGGASFGFGFGFALSVATLTTNVQYVLQVSQQGAPLALHEVPPTAGGAAVAVDPGGHPFLLANTNRQPLRFGQLPLTTPRGNGEMVLAHIGLVLSATRLGRAGAGPVVAYLNPAGPHTSVTISCDWD